MYTALKEMWNECTCSSYAMFTSKNWNHATVWLMENVQYLKNNLIFESECRGCNVKILFSESRFHDTVDLSENMVWNIYYSSLGGC